MRLLAMVARRIAWMPPTLLGLVLLVFAISHVVPSDPARIMAGENATPEQVAKVRHEFGLDLPLPVQFAHYVRDVASGDMGTSLFTQRPVADDLLDAPAGDVRVGDLFDRIGCSSRCAARRGRRIEAQFAA